MPIEWKVPLSDLDWGPEEAQAVARVMESKWITMGTVTEEFERTFARYLGVDYAFAMTNCTAALHLASLLAGAAPGDEVICPSLTFVATSNCVIYAGATPVFADITGFDDLTISPEEVERRITPRTKAIIVMHYGGHACDLSRIMDLARRHGLIVIEDAAHAPGAEYDGRKLGTIGDVGCFSFFSSKNVAIGEAGLIVTNRKDWAEKIKFMRSHGMTTLTWDRHQGHASTYDVVELGYNYRPDEIRSAIGLVQLGKLDDSNRRRAAIAKYYRESLGNVPGMTLPFNRPNGQPSHHLFPLLLEEESMRPSFMQRMREARVQTSIHYPPIHLFSYYRQHFDCCPGSLPITEQAASREVSLPMYASMSDEQVEHTVESVKRALGAFG